MQPGRAVAGDSDGHHYGEAVGAPIGQELVRQSPDLSSQPGHVDARDNTV